MTVDPYEAERQQSLEEYERRERKVKVFRVSDTDRERAIRQLRQHLSDGRLDMDEFTERMETVYQAKTNLDIDQALHELPFVSVDPAILASSGPPVRRELGPFAPAGGRPARPGARHTAAFALASAATFVVLSIIVSLFAEDGFGFLVILLPMTAWAVWMFIQATREIGRDD